MRPGIVEILTIGDELCRGEIVNTNAATLAADLRARGMAVGFLTTCRDVGADIEAALRHAATRADWIIVGGGLGPTEDDLTVDVMARLLGVEARVDPEAVARWTARVTRPLTPQIMRQFRAPVGARIWANTAGAAPGFDVTLWDRRVTCVPGPPREVASIWTQVAAELPPPQPSRRLRVFGLGESQIVARLEDLVRPDGLLIHYRIAFPEVLLSFSGAGTEAIARVADTVRARLGPLVYGEGDDDLPRVVVTSLVARGLTIATAESCTGGLVGQLLSSIPGASRTYAGGAVAYANAAKTELLGVPTPLLAGHGAVSEPVARAMAEGIRSRLGTSHGVAITGIAGPDGGTPDKPVGTVWIAFATAHGTTARHVHLPFARDQVRLAAAWHALAGLLDL